MKKLAVFGLDPALLQAAGEANRRNQPLVGLWSSRHDEALLASLALGCPAFPTAAEPWAEAELIWWSEWPAELGSPDHRCSGPGSGWTPSI